MLFRFLAGAKTFLAGAAVAGTFLAVVVNGLIVLGAVTGVLAIVPAALVALFVSLTILFALETFRGLELGDGFAIESHWGGLGGGLGGWRISRPLIFLIAALVCAGLTFAVASPYLQIATTPANMGPTSDGAPAPEDSGSGAAPANAPDGGS